MSRRDDDVIKFCLRVKEWCRRNNWEYCGDAVIAPVFENVMDEIIHRLEREMAEKIGKPLKEWEKLHGGKLPACRCHVCIALSILDEIIKEEEHGKE